MAGLDLGSKAKRNVDRVSKYTVQHCTVHVYYYVTLKSSLTRTGIEPLVRFRHRNAQKIVYYTTT